MKEHAWELTSSKWQSTSVGTRYEWKCEGCGRTTYTNTSGSHGTAQADAFRPGRRALQGSWIDPDCTLALVDAVHDL